MIKGISQSGRYTQVTNGSPGSVYVNNYSGQPGVGNLRYNPSTSSIEVFDGNAWMMMAMNYASVGLTSEAESLLDWAREQRNKQWEYEAKAKDHPAVKNALDALIRAQDQLDLVYKLSKDYENEGVATSP